MKDVLFQVQKNERLTQNVYRMELSGDTSEITRPGQFINFKIDSLYLRRPISVCDRTNGLVTVIYKVVGKGTQKMSRAVAGDTFWALTGLGNGYDCSLSGDSPLLIGGGVGVPPLYMLAKELRNQQKKVSVVLGFNTKDEVFYEDAFASLGCEVTVTTADGSYGKKGFVTDAMPHRYSHIFTCGPEPMLRAVYRASETSGQFSFEERMGCGFGACMGCSCKTVTGCKRICKDGPVMKKEEILWEA